MDVWNERALPTKAVPIPFRAVVRASLLPMVVWGGVACLVWFVYAPWATAVLVLLFVASFLMGATLRHRKGHTVRCSVFGAFGGVLDKAMAGL
ncbi:hypothetical protein AB0J38_13565 [Streptomyces sp. NPDC050095]|uniref:hypothetical protein n=1 Tax=unclassified Streptomyces TaxID=2593676 RepID=UPI003447949D